MPDEPITIQGSCEPAFQAVAYEFERNFQERGELGASVAITLDGRTVVDLWAGVADETKEKQWERDTVAVIFSATKGLSAMCMHILIDRGLLDPNVPVAQYWPEFAANGKAAITVAHIMSHQAGLPVWQDPVHLGGLLDWEFATSRLAAEAPLWEPGTTHGYHAVTLGFLEGEIVRRITGKTIGRFLRDEIGEPLGADIWIGLPESEEERVAPLLLNSESNPESGFYKKLIAEPEWFGWKVIMNSGGDAMSENVNSRARRASENPAAGGISNGRGLARAYAPFALDGSVDGVRLVKKEAIALMKTVRSASDCDVVLRLPTTFTLGFSKSWGARRLGSVEYVILGEHAFGTPGMGGSIGFADPDARMSFGYVMNKHGRGVGMNERGQSMIDAAYRAVGYKNSEPGFWVR